MPVDEDLTARLRAATTDLRSAPVRLDRVARKARRRMALGLLLAALVGAAAVAVVSAGLLAGKAAVDPTYHPPLVRSERSAKLSVGFGEPHAARGHARLRDFLATANQSREGYDAAQLSSEGFVFDVRVELVGYRDAVATVGWSVLDSRTRRRLAISLHPDTGAIRPRANDEVKRLSVWVPYPARAGKFVVRFRLTDAEGHLIRERTSAPFIALRKDFFRPYATPTYRARIPVGWKITQDYDPAPGGRFVTVARGPKGELLDIDTTPRWKGVLARSARKLEAIVGTQVGYRRLVFQPESLGTGDAFEWSFRLRRDPVYKTDIFLRRGGDGFAILTVGRRGQYSELRALARSVARSIDPR